MNVGGHVNGSGALAAGLRAREQPILAAYRHAAHGALGDIVIDLGDAIIEKKAERVPALAAIGERLRHRRLGRQATQGIVDDRA